MKKSFLLLLLFLSVNSTARAQELSDSSYIFEPYVGFEAGFLTQKGIPEITTQGVNFGIRLGMNFSGISLGLDYMSAAVTAEQDDETGDFKPTDIGIFVGHKFESGVTVYLSFFISDKAEIEPNEEDFSGSGYKIGLGWRLYSSLEIAIELINRKYLKYDDEDMNDPLLGSSAGVSFAIPLL